MIPEKLLEIMKQDGVVAIATLGKEGPHLVNTWNGYIRVPKYRKDKLPNLRWIPVPWSWNFR